MNKDDRNEIIQQEKIIQEMTSQNDKLEQENKILKQELQIVQTNQYFQHQQKYDEKVLKIKIQTQSIQNKGASELKFCLYEAESVLEISGLLYEIDDKKQSGYDIIYQKIKLEKKVIGDPIIIQTEKNIEITFEVSKLQ